MLAIGVIQSLFHTDVRKSKSHFHAAMSLYGASICCYLQVSVVIDDARAGPINFKPTVMFQTRLFNFNLKNAGLGNVDYKWAVQTLDGATDTSGTYVVSRLAELCPSLLLTSILAAV